MLSYFNNWSALLSKRNQSFPPPSLCVLVKLIQWVGFGHTLLGAFHRGPHLLKSSPCPTITHRTIPPMRYPLTFPIYHCNPAEGIYERHSRFPPLLPTTALLDCSLPLHPPKAPFSNKNFDFRMRNPHVT